MNFLPLGYSFSCRAQDPPLGAADHLWTHISELLQEIITSDKSNVLQMQKGLLCFLFPVGFMLFGFIAYSSKGRGVLQNNVKLCQFHKHNCATGVKNSRVLTRTLRAIVPSFQPSQVICPPSQPRAVFHIWAGIECWMENSSLKELLELRLGRKITVSFDRHLSESEMSLFPCHSQCPYGLYAFQLMYKHR